MNSFEMLDFNINLFLNNISEQFHIPRSELEQFKDYKPEQFNTRYVEKTMAVPLYKDQQERKYVVLKKTEGNRYLALRVVEHQS